MGEGRKNLNRVLEWQMWPMNLLFIHIREVSSHFHSPPRNDMQEKRMSSTLVSQYEGSRVVRPVQGEPPMLTGSAGGDPSHPA